jgi:hypothetical protein
VWKRKQGVEEKAGCGEEARFRRGGREGGEEVGERRRVREGRI